MDENVDNIVGDIIQQLNGSAQQVKDVAKVEDDITRETLEEFVIKSASKLVQTSLSIVENVRFTTGGAAEPEDIEATSALIKSTSAAIETLNKLTIANSRNSTQKEIKKADIEAKANRNLADNQTRLVMSREEIMKQIMKGANDKPSLKDDPDVIELNP